MYQITNKHTLVYSNSKISQVVAYLNLNPGGFDESPRTFFDGTSNLKDIEKKINMVEVGWISPRTIMNILYTPSRHSLLQRVWN